MPITLSNVTEYLISECEQWFLYALVSLLRDLRDASDPDSAILSIVLDRIALTGEEVTWILRFFLFDLTDHAQIRCLLMHPIMRPKRSPFLMDTLFIAIEDDDTPRVKLLLNMATTILERDPDKRLTDRMQQCLMAVFRCGSFEVITAVLEHGIVPAPDNHCLLQLVVERTFDTEECREKLITLLTGSYGVDIDSSIVHDDGSAFYFTCSSKVDSERLARFLVSKGSNPFRKCRGGRTALHAACESGAGESVITYLLSLGLSFLDKDDEGNSPLHSVVASNDAHRVKRILSLLQ